MSLYSKNIVELQTAFETLVEKWNLTVVKGIKGNEFEFEDGLPWLEVEGLKNKKDAKIFLKELANGLGINIAYNRFEQRGTKTLHAIFDINAEYLNEHGIDAALPSFSEDPESLEYLEDFCEEMIRPS